MTSCMSVSCALRQPCIPAVWHPCYPTVLEHTAEMLEISLVAEALLCGGVDVWGSGEVTWYSGLVSRLRCPGGSPPLTPGWPCSAALTRRTRCCALPVLLLRPRALSRCPTAPRAGVPLHHIPPGSTTQVRTRHRSFSSPLRPQTRTLNLSLQAPPPLAYREKVSRGWPPTDRWSQRSRLAECLSSGLPASCKPSPPSPHASSASPHFQPTTDCCTSGTGSFVLCFLHTWPQPSS